MSAAVIACASAWADAFTAVGVLFGIAALLWAIGTWFK